ETTVPRKKAASSGPPPPDQGLTNTTRADSRLLSARGTAPGDRSTSQTRRGDSLSEPLLQSIGSPRLDQSLPSRQAKDLASPGDGRLEGDAPHTAPPPLALRAKSRDEKPRVAIPRPGSGPAATGLDSRSTKRMTPNDRATAQTGVDDRFGAPPIRPPMASV